MKAAISKSLFTTLFILLIAGISTAYGYNPVRQSELSNLCVRAIVKDSYGYIWIATANGLCKSYGNEYEIYFGEIDDHGHSAIELGDKPVYRQGRLAARGHKSWCMRSQKRHQDIPPFPTRE